VELGYRDLVVTAPWAIVGPAGLPAPVQRQIHAAFSEAMNDARFQETLAWQDLPPAYAGIKEKEYGSILLATADREEALMRRLCLQRNQACEARVYMYP